MIDNYSLKTQNIRFKLVASIFDSIPLTLQANIKNIYLSLKNILFSKKRLYSQRYFDFHAECLRYTIYCL